MGQLKASEVEAWLVRERSGIPIVLIYGPDRGLVSERAKRFAERAGIPLDDPFSVVRLEASELDKDPGRLVDEANTVPMFAGRRLLWVRNAQGQKTLGDDVKALCAKPPQETLVLIEAGELKKSVALRSVVEASPNAIALPCYSDDDDSIDTVIDEELRKAGLAIDPDARRLLRRSLGGDRIASRAEVEKLTIYAQGRERIGVKDVRALTGDVSGMSVDEAVDAMLEGNVAALDLAFSRQALGASQVYTVLSAVQRQMHALQLMRAVMEKEGRNASAAVTAARPPVFSSRRKLVEQTLKRWDSQALGRILMRLHQTVLQTRQRPELSVALARQALLAIAVDSARQSASSRG